MLAEALMTNDLLDLYLHRSTCATSPIGDRNRAFFVTTILAKTGASRKGLFQTASDAILEVWQAKEPAEPVWACDCGGIFCGTEDIGAEGSAEPVGA